MTCWGHNSQAVGHQFAFDLARCRRCGRKLTGKRTPLWFDSHPEREPECAECASARHRSCPCLGTGDALPC